MFDLKKAHQAIHSLPAGHTGIREAQESIDHEYGACQALERAFAKKWKGPRRLSGLQEAADFSAELCRALGSRLIKEVRPMEPGHDYCGGYYKNRTIYVHSGYISTITVIHETTHHICFVEQGFVMWGHGKHFQEVEQMLFDYLLSKPKQPEWYELP